MIKKYLEKYQDRVTIIGPLLNHLPEINPPILYVDGGAIHQQGEGLSIGDNDSFEGELDLKLPTEKDYSDLSFVLSNIDDKIKFLFLYGFLGGRKDHELMNLGEIHLFLKERQHNVVKIDSQIMALSAQKDFTFTHEGVFSLFSFEPNEVSLQGACKYPILEHEFPALSSLGLSNIAHGEVQIECSQPIFIFLESLDQ